GINSIVTFGLILSYSFIKSSKTVFTSADVLKNEILTFSLLFAGASDDELVSFPELLVLPTGALLELEQATKKTRRTDNIKTNNCFFIVKPPKFSKLG